MAGTIRVVIVDDHRLIADSLAVRLEHEPALIVLALHHDAASAIAAAPTEPADVILLDAKLGERGFDDNDVRAIATATAPARVVMVSAYTERQIVRRSLAAGALGYVAKSDSTDALMTVIQAALRGETALSPSVAAVMASHPAELSERDELIVDCVARGMSNTEIAAEMLLTPSTVEKHVATACRKLGVRGRGGIVAWALQRRP